MKMQNQNKYTGVKHSIEFDSEDIGQAVNHIEKFLETVYGFEVFLNFKTQFDFYEPSEPRKPRKKK